MENKTLFTDTLALLEQVATFFEENRDNENMFDVLPQGQASDFLLVIDRCDYIVSMSQGNFNTAD